MAVRETAYTRIESGAWRGPGVKVWRMAGPGVKVWRAWIRVVYTSIGDTAYGFKRGYPRRTREACNMKA